MKRILSIPVLVFSAMIVLSACGETADTGEPVTIPTVTATCSGCGIYGKKVLIWITPFNCDIDQVGYAVASQTISNCSVGSCSTSFSGWTGDTGPISTVPSGTYSICGSADISNNDPADYTDNKESSLSNITINGSGSTHYLSSWN